MDKPHWVYASLLRWLSDHAHFMEVFLQEVVDDHMPHLPFPYEAKHECIRELPSLRVRNSLQGRSDIKTHET